VGCVHLVYVILSVQGRLISLRCGKAVDFSPENNTCVRSAAVCVMPAGVMLFLQYSCSVVWCGVFCIIRLVTTAIVLLLLQLNLSVLISAVSCVRNGYECADAVQLPTRVCFFWMVLAAAWLPDLQCAAAPLPRG
jgi:hypothetical protein